MEGQGQFERVAESVPPFAPARAVFPCPRLLALAARAALGGARETLLGAVMAARLLSAMRLPRPVEPEARRARAEAARLWLGALTLPARARGVLVRAFAASATEDRGAAADAVAAVTEVTAPHLDRAARSELTQLADGLRADAGLLAGAPDGPVE